MVGRVGATRCVDMVVLGLFGRRASFRSGVAVASLLALSGCSSAREPNDPSSMDRAPAWFHAHDVGPRCDDMERDEELLCRADKRLMQARESGDDRAVACYDRKSRELRTAYRLAQDTKERLKSSENAVDRERLTYADKTLERNFVELEACNGPLDGEGDEVRVTRPELVDGL
jgi:hypothetical protein